jgi:hypothetical protein
VFNDPLKLYSNGSGGEIYFGTELTAKSLTVFGSGHTSTYTANQSFSTGLVLNDSLKVQGNISISTTSGNLIFGQSGFPYYVGGSVSSTNTADTLTLTAGNFGDVLFIS